MNRGLKITLIITGSLLVAGGITFAIVKSVRKRKAEKKEVEEELKETQQLEEINQNLESQQTVVDDNMVRNGCTTFHEYFEPLQHVLSLQLIHDSYETSNYY